MLALRLPRQVLLQVLLVASLSFYFQHAVEARQEPPQQDETPVPPVEVTSPKTAAEPEYVYTEGHPPPKSSFVMDAKDIVSESFKMSMIGGLGVAGATAARYAMKWAEALPPLTPVFGDAAKRLTSEQALMLQKALRGSDDHSFDDVIGRDHIKSYIKNAIDKRFNGTGDWNADGQFAVKPPKYPHVHLGDADTTEPAYYLILYQVVGKELIEND